jgi:protoporphyrinogen oxidase
VTKSNDVKTVLIIGAGPAGLTAALELARNSNIRPVVIEALDDVGGISRTIEYKGNRMDIGGHRFFSKSDWVMNWWKEVMPVASNSDVKGISVLPNGDRFMLIRGRLSRIYFLRKFFDYPISVSVRTMSNLGVVRMMKIGFAYCWSTIFQIKPEKNLEDFFINRFGKELYQTFFKDYTEKVWGVACRSISPAWGAQRIKGLSITRAMVHAIRKYLFPTAQNIAQKETETSLIERFLYPKLGPGQMWRFAADELLSLGGQIHFGQRVCKIHCANGLIQGVETESQDGSRLSWQADIVISTMAIRDLVNSVTPPVSESVRDVAAGLMYRDFITMGLQVKRLKAQEGKDDSFNLLPDTWIYIQEPDVKIGRLQIFNNWSPALVKNANTVWMGLEYFCQEGDDLWSLDDAQFSSLAISELAKINIIDPVDVMDFHVVRIPKAYPAYFGSYDRFGEIRTWADTIQNLYLIGRNGQHRYNNQDHSMLTAKLAAESILAGGVKKEAIWDVNVEEGYHEEK